MPHLKEVLVALGLVGALALAQELPSGPPIAISQAPSPNLGSMSQQNANSVAITGGAITGLGAVSTVTLTVNGQLYSPPLSATSGNVGGGLLLAGACATQTVSMPGLVVGMVVIPTPLTYPGVGVYWYARATGAGVATLYVCGIVAVTPAVSTYNLIAWAPPS